MAQNDNQQQENRAFKKEDAYETLGIINTWIGNMDTKVSFALALAGVLIGVIFESVVGILLVQVFAFDMETAGFVVSADVIGLHAYFFRLDTLHA